MKKQIEIEQWKQLDIKLQIDWVRRFGIRDIWKALPNIGQIMDYLEGEWLPYRDEIFSKDGEVIDRLWALLIQKRNKDSRKNN